MSRLISLDPGDRILVSRTDRLGDLILALPVVESLAQRFPEVSIDVMASLYASPVLDYQPHIRKVWRLQSSQLRKSGAYRKDLLARIRREEYRAVLILYPQRLVAKLLYDAEIPLRLGTAGRFHSVFFNEHVYHSRKKNLKHESEYNLDFLELFADGPTVTAPRLVTTEREQRYARRVLDEAGIGDNYLILHPGSGGSSETWPVEKFIELAEHLDDTQIVFTGSRDDAPIQELLPGSLRKRSATMIGTTDMRTLSAIIAGAETVVANSTGPLHLAAALGRRVVGLYSAKPGMAPIRWGPLGTGHEVLTPIAADGEPDPSQPLSGLAIERVLEAVSRIRTGTVTA